MEFGRAIKKTQAITAASFCSGSPDEDCWRKKEGNKSPGLVENEKTKKK